MARFELANTQWNLTNPEGVQISETFGLVNGFNEALCSF